VLAVLGKYARDNHPGVLDATDIGQVSSISEEITGLRANVEQLRKGWKDAVTATYVIAQHMDELSRGIHSDDASALEYCAAVNEALERVMDCLGK
jgi:hypothetical protein